MLPNETATILKLSVFLVFDFNAEFFSSFRFVFGFISEKLPFRLLLL